MTHDSLVISEISKAAGGPGLSEEEEAAQNIDIQRVTSQATDYITAQIVILYQGC